jgi:hypothetical protein
MPATPWNRRIADAFTERLGYKAIALFFAIALWIAASGEETAAHYVPVRFLPVTDASVRLVSRPPVVRALVSGPTRELLKLYAVPPSLRRAFGAETPDDVSLDLHPSDIDLPAGVERVTVRDVLPHVLPLRFQVVHPPVADRPRADSVAAARSDSLRTESLRADSMRAEALRAAHDSARRIDSARAVTP